MEMMKLKVATKRMAGYTGVLGMVRFTDGVSDEYLPRHIRDRMAASMEFLEVDAAGNEQPAGAQHRVIREYKERAPKIENLTRQTEAEKAAEITAAVVATVKVLSLETRETLEAIAEEKGIKGLREIGGKWGVKHRAIPTLIEMILDAQEKSVAAREKKLAAKVEAERTNDPTATAELKVDEGEIAHTSAEAEEAAKAEVAEFLTEQGRIKSAAASGDLSAALSGIQE